MRAWARWMAAAVALGGCRDGDDRGSGPNTFGLGTAGDSAMATAGDDAAADVGTATGDGSGGTAPGCPGACEPAELQQQACPAGCGSQFRVCNEDCTFSPWSDCAGAAGGECMPGQVQSCGDCMEQTCQAGCTWGPCEAIECSYTCLNGVSARNGSEICDDEAFEVPPQPLFLYCVTGEGGVAYVANNTGPAQADGVTRCQGWEDQGLDAWDYLDYVVTLDCTAEGLAVPVNLPPGTGAWFGVHDQPDGSGHFTEVCVATAP